MRENHSSDCEIGVSYRQVVRAHRRRERGLRKRMKAVARAGTGELERLVLQMRCSASGQSQRWRRKAAAYAASTRGPTPTNYLTKRDA